MMSRACFLTVSFALFASNSICFATERYVFYRGVRSLGMGGAVVTTVNDETALYSNPAALAKLRDHFVTLVDPEVEMGAATYGATGSNDVLRMSDPQRALGDALKNQGETLHERAQISPSVVVPGFGVGLLGKYDVSARVNPDTNAFEYQYTNDFAAVTGVGVRLAGGLIKVGASARLVDRAEVSRTDIPVDSTDLSLTNLESRGLGLAGDLGVLASAPVAWLPTVGAVYHDLGQTAFNREGGVFHRTEIPPAAVPSSLDVGISIFPIVGQGARMTWSIEYDGIDSAATERDQMSRVHFGTELNLRDAIFMRAGLNQRYWTAGVEMAVAQYQFQLATYGEELGDNTAPREDRRFVAKFAIRF